MTGVQTCALPISPIIENNLIIINAKPTIDLTSLSPKFVLTKGAVICPESGSTHDFSTGMSYQVTSEDKKWSKDYEIRFNLNGPKTNYSFENFELVNNKYYKFYELNNGVKQDWASGNSGYNMSGLGKSPDLFPTYFSEDAIDGNYALKLETRTTGNWGAGFEKPIAAGNLYLGTFNALSAIDKPLLATRFGVPFSLKPLWLKGSYKYKAGSVFTDKLNNVLNDRKDIFDIYAVLFDVTNLKNDYLTGEDILTSSEIVAIARIKDGVETEEYLEFNIPFEYSKEYDKDKQEGIGRAHV